MSRYVRCRARVLGQGASWTKEDRDVTVVKELDECADAPTTEIGGKASGLGALISHGYPVPDGFVVVTGAYDRVVDGTGVRELIKQIMGKAEVGQASATLRALFDDLVLPDDIASGVVAAYEALVA